MKKILMLLSLICCSVASFAQVKAYNDMAIGEAIKIAKEEGKKVVVMACTSTCGPCRAMVRDLFPSEDMGEFIAKDFVLVKYITDKNDVGDFSKKYNIQGYPAFLYFDYEGREIARKSGAVFDVEGFKELLSELVEDKHSWASMEEFLKQDSVANGMEYIDFLIENGKEPDALKFYGKLFDMRTVEQNYAKDSRDFVNSHFRDLNYKFYTYMAKNKKEVVNVMGESDYNSYINSKVNMYVGDVVFRAKSASDFDESIALGKKYKPFNNSIMRYVAKYGKLITGDANSYKELCDISSKLIVKGKIDKDYIGNVIYILQIRTYMTEGEEVGKAFKSFLESIIQCDMSSMDRRFIESNLRRM